MPSPTLRLSAVVYRGATHSTWHRIVMASNVAKPEQVRLLHHSVIDPLSKVHLYLKASFLQVPLAKIVAG